MKIKTFNSFNESKSDIDSICNKYNIKNYTIVDGLVNVNGDVDLSYNNLHKLPVRFGIVNGHFNCSYNSLASINGSPHIVKGSFNCDSNTLTTLEGSPNIVQGSFHCRINNLTDLIGSPNTVGGYFSCSRNRLLTSLEGTPDSIEGLFYCSDTPIGSIFQSDNPGLIEMFNAIFIDSVDLEKIEYWFSIIKQDLTEDKIKKIKKYYPNI
jgi:hypothetical protein